MLYICYHKYYGLYCKVSEFCNHRYPHKLNDNCFHNKTPCSCVPLDLKYYMKEILEKDKK